MSVTSKIGAIFELPARVVPIERYQRIDII